MHAQRSYSNSNQGLSDSLGLKLDSLGLNIARSIITDPNISATKFSAIPELSQSDCCQNVQNK